VEAALTPSTQASALDLARRVGIIVAALREVIGIGFLDQPHLVRFGAPLWSRLSRILARFTDLMDRLAAGRWPRQRRGPHTGGAPHPENLRRGNSSPTNPGWLMIIFGRELAGCRAQLEALLAEPASAEILAKVPAAERILRPLRRMLGLGRRRRRPRTVGRKSGAYSADATIPAAAPSVGDTQPSPEPRPSGEPEIRSPAWDWYGVYPPFKKPA
jgi:hypothetical protein